MGFRPFFLAAAVWAVLVMAVWALLLSGRLALPTAFDPVSWHAHEALFGYLGAVLAGFLLTAVPNWSGRPPITGWTLLALLALWLLGRGAIAASAFLPVLMVAAIDLSCLVTLCGLVLYQIVAGRNWRNLVVVAAIGVFVIGNGLFHWEAASDRYAASGYGQRAGLAAGIMLIAIIGGRIVPTFTRNWLMARGESEKFPAAFGRVDKLALALTLVALPLWAVAPHWLGSGCLLLAAGLCLIVRLSRWRGWQTRSESLVWILHAGYAFVPLGMLAMSAAILWPESLPQSTVQHIWMAGAIGIMTLAVMTRATLGHTGRPLEAGMGTTAIYLLVITSVLIRVLSIAMPDSALTLYTLSASLWCLGFTGFTVLYGPLLVRNRPGQWIPAHRGNDVKSTADK